MARLPHDVTSSVLLVLLMAAAANAWQTLPPETLPSKEALVAANMCGPTPKDFPITQANYNFQAILDFYYNNMLDKSVGITGYDAYFAEHCILLNVNEAIRYLFKLPAFQRITGGACQFNGFRTWNDFAALLSAPDTLAAGPTGPYVAWSTNFDGNSFKDAGSMTGFLGNAVDKQAGWVQSGRCAADGQLRTYAQHMEALKSLPRPPIMANAALRTDVTKCPGATDLTRLDLMCLGDLMERMQSRAAITCDCTKLSWETGVALLPAGTCGKPTMTAYRTSGPSVFNQATLNSLLNNKQLTGSPWRFGTPLIANCAA